MELKKRLTNTLAACGLLACSSLASANFADTLGEMGHPFTNVDYSDTFKPVIPNTPGCGFDGIYLGGGLGAQYGDATVRGTSYVSTPPLAPFSVISNQQDTNISGFNFEGRAFLGYGYVFDRLYIGGELGGDFGRYNESANHVTSFPNFVGIGLTNKDKLQTNSAVFTMDLLPGVLLTHTTLAYVRIGTEPNNLKLTNSSTFMVLPVPFGFGAINTTTINNVSRWPVRFGVGLQQHVTQRIDIRGDLIFQDFGNVTTQGIVPTSLGGIPLFAVSQGHAKLFTSQAMVSALIHI